MSPPKDYLPAADRPEGGRVEDDRHREPGRPEPHGSEGLRCELCGGPVLDRHCKVVCLNCGFTRDCSDP